MNRKGRITRIGVFCLKFLAIAPVFLVAWWLVVPAYSWLLGQISGGIINAVGDRTIDALRVESQGVLGTETSLVLTTEGHEVVLTIALILRTAPGYVLLVLATPALGIGRRLRALIMGSGILFVGHVLFLVLMFLFVYGNESAQAAIIADVLGKFLLTLPFLLWLALAYWDRVMAFLAEDDETAADKPNNEKGAPAESP